MGVIGPRPEWYEVPLPEPAGVPVREPAPEQPAEQPTGPAEVPA